MRRLRRLYWRLIGWRLYDRKIRRSDAYKRAAATGKWNEVMKVYFPENRIEELADRPFIRMLRERK